MAKRRVLNSATVATALLPLAIGMGANMAMSNNASSSNPATEASVFAPVCTLPFKGAAVPAIDGKCGMKGGSSDPADRKSVV